MGFLRLYLALTVLFWHSPPDIFRFMPTSAVAVLCFFIISGFYMAMVLTEKYRDDLLGFYVGRAKRLYPVYWIVLFVFSFHVPLGGILKVTGQALIFPYAAWITLYPGPEANPFALQPIYTVALEMMFYALAPFLALRSLMGLLAVFAVSVVLHFAPAWLGLPPRPWQYEFFPCVFVFFAAGMLSYRLYRAIKPHPQTRLLGYIALPAILGCVWLIDGVGTGHYVNSLPVYGLYVLVAALIPALFIVSKTSSLDRFLGSLSYPLYVVHFPIVLLMDNWAARAVSIAIAIAIVLAIERPLENMRIIMGVPGRSP